MSRHSEGLEEAVLKVASGGAQRNPRWGGGEYVGLEEVAMPAATLRRGGKKAAPPKAASPAPAGFFHPVRSAVF